MSHDDNWDWISDLPESWVPPQELKSPTRIPFDNLVIQILASEMVGNDIVDLLGQLLSAHASFNRWCGSAGKNPKPLQEVLRLGSKASDVTRRLHEAWSRFSETFENAGRREGTAVAERASLVATLNEGISELKLLVD